MFVCRRQSQLWRFACCSWTWRPLLGWTQAEVLSRIDSTWIPYLGASSRTGSVCGICPQRKSPHGLNTCSEVFGSEILHAARIITMRRGLKGRRRHESIITYEGDWNMEEWLWIHDFIFSILYGYVSLITGALLFVWLGVFYFWLACLSVQGFQKHFQTFLLNAVACTKSLNQVGSAFFLKLSLYMQQ